MGIGYTVLIINLIFFFSLVKMILKKDLMHPLFVFSTAISVQYWMYLIFYSEQYILSNTTNLLLIISLFSFVIGIIFSNATFSLLKKSVPTEESVVRVNIHFNKYKKTLLILGFIGFFIGGIYAYIKGISGPYNFWFNIRYMHIYGDTSQGIAPYLILLLHIAFLFIITLRKVEINKKANKVILIVGLVLICNGLFSMAKTEILMTVISSLGVYVLSNRYIYKNTKNNNIIALCSLIIFFGFTFIVNIARGGASAFEVIYNYIAYPLVAFDKVILGKSLSAGGETFSLLHKILSLLGLVDYKKFDLDLQPGDFNVFTFMSSPYLDFGVYGLFFIFLFLGFLYGFVYSFVKKGHVYWIVYYSILLYPLCMVFFDYQFNLTSLIYYLIILVTLFLSSKIKVISNEQITTEKL